MPVVINKFKQQDIEDMKNPNVNSMITVINIRQETYAGIKPGQIGQIDLIKWGPYQFALKRLDPGRIPKEEPSKKDISKPYGELDFGILLRAFIKAAGGNARAAVMLGVERTNVSNWLLGLCKPATYNKENFEWEHLLELLTDQEKPLLKQYYVQLLEEKKNAPKESVSKTPPAKKQPKRGRPTKAKGTKK